LEASIILNVVDVQKYYSLGAILLASHMRRRQEHHKGFHPPLRDDITIPIKYPSQKATNIVIAVAVVVAALVTLVP
jgi:hypothetical protein